MQLIFIWFLSWDFYFYNFYSMFSFRISYLLLPIIILSSCTSSSVQKIENNTNNFWTSASQVVSSTVVSSGISSTPIANNSGSISVASGSNALVGISPDTSTIDTEKDKCLQQSWTGIGQQNCNDNFNIKKALITKNTTICDTITSSSLQDTCKDNLIFQDILAKKDPSLCTKIKNPDAAGNCYAVIWKLIQSADGAKQWKIANPCNEIKDPTIKLACKDAFTLNEAVQKKDLTLCTTLINKDKRSMCSDFVKSVSEKNPSK